MTIVADRFLVRDDRPTIDLATGASVVLRIGTGGGPAEQLRWSLRCDTLLNVHHPRMAPLLDFGALGDSRRFEAWQCGAGWNGRRDEAMQAVRAVSQFLSSCGLTATGPSPAHVHRAGDRAVVIPPEDTAVGESEDNGNPRNEVSLDNCGVRAADRRADAAIEELIKSFAGSRPHIVTVWGPRGSGRTTTALRAARVARTNGFIPIALPSVGQLDRGIVSERQLCVIGDACAGVPWTAMLKAALASPRGHIALWFGDTEIRGVHGIRLEPLSPEALVASIRPAALDGRLQDRVRRAAAGADGLPGRFVARLWRGSSYASPPDQRPQFRSRVAEQPTAYASGGQAADIAAGHYPNWPAPAELAALRQRSHAAADLLKRGRHAPGVRQLRQTIGALLRRDDWTHASQAALALASALRRRGDPRAALAVLDEAQPSLDRTGSETALIEAAVISGHARIDLTRLDEAEAVLATALAASRRLGDPVRVASAMLALSRCLFWKGLYADAAATLRPAADAGTALNVRMKIAASRAAVGLADLTRAMALVRDAAEHASKADDVLLRARVSYGAAFVRLANGDVEAAGNDVTACIAAARAGHDPMMSMRARLLLAEVHRRLRRSTASATFLRRARRMHVPPIVLARIDLLHRLSQTPDAAFEAVVQHASRCGLPALRLYVDRGMSSAALDSTDDIVTILHLCQSADDETRVLAEVCGRLRRQLHAAAIAIVTRDRSGISAIAADGARIEPDIALRAIGAEAAIAPHWVDDRIEAAVPIRYGGSVIGAAAARWLVGTPYELSRAVSVLTMSVTAAAPVISAAVTRRACACPPVLPDIVGVTTAMSELREGIERAARAPFAVLIEGESGSGKEVVAKAIHRLGHARERPLCTLNCAALPDDLIEAELFGHARGAFTGAIAERAGVFEEAHGGTLFLDEVGELSPRAQAKLLRVIQEGELRRIGENTSRRVDVRVVSATNRNLRSDVASGRFRADLLYRLDVIRLTVPPLRDRREDIALLADRFWREAAARVGSRAVLSAAAVAALARYDWPGNIRELQNVLAALAVRTPRRGVVMPSALPVQFGDARRVDVCRLADARRTFEERFVRAALVRTGGHRGRAASELGLTRQGLTKLLSRLGIQEAAR